MSPMPPYLKPGDTVGITCPSGHYPMEDIQPSVQALKEWGYAVQIGRTVGVQDFQFAGTDLERAADLQTMLDDPDIKAILFGRGGYGTVRIIDRIHFNTFYQSPKWLIGYSDITVLHSHIQSQFHIPTLHAEMCIDLKDSTTDPSAVSLRDALRGDRIHYPVAPNPLNRAGSSSGILVGGNLSLIVSLTGSASDLETYGKILFLEDVGEYLYNIDRMIYTLQRAGKLSFLAGLVVGGLTHLKDDDGDPFGQTGYQIIRDRVKVYDYPVCFGFPSGHEQANYALKLGLPHSLEVGNNEVRLMEII